jgi:hypothetical protein
MKYLEKMEILLNSPVSNLINIKKFEEFEKANNMFIIDIKKSEIFMQNEIPT